MSPHDAFDLHGLDPSVAPIVELVLRIVGGDFSARGRVSERGGDLDAVVVALNMLAESFQVEQAARHRAEALLADATDTYDNAPDLFCSCEVGSFRIVKCNQTMARTLGIDAEEVLQRSILDLVEPSSRGPLRAALETLATTGSSTSTEIALARQGLPAAVTSLAGSVKHGADGRPERLRLVLRDVTTERALEEQLLHSQRMEAIGRLAGGVAHDFNNLLMVIQSAATLLAPRLEGRASELIELSLIQESSERAAALTRDLLAFSRREPLRGRTVVVDEVIEKARGIFERLLGRSIRLEMKLASGGATVHIDPGRLEQALVNLVVNARDAMPEGGTLTLRTRAVSLPADELSVRKERVHGAHVEVRVSDTGSGIDPEVATRIFEPFFTTKPVGKGTGLGLSTVYGTVRQAGGSIELSPSAGPGSTFVVLLPQTGAPAPDAATEQTSREATRARPTTILLVEDDDRVRAVIARVLRGAAYRVLEAATGAEALALADAEGDAVDLVVSDVMMPSLSGPETLRRLRQKRPALRCIFVTGFAHERNAELVSAANAVLEKPFLPSALLATVRSVLEAG